VVLLSPVALQNLPATAIFWVDALRDHLAAAGYRLEFQASQAGYSPHPEHALETLLQKHQPAGWVLYLSTAPQQHWFNERGLPCVVSGSLHSGIELGSVDIDYVATCQHAAGQFAAKGHRRAALLMPRSEQAGNLESERGFREAGPKLRPHPVETLVVHHDGSVPGICRALDGLSRGSRAVTGVLVAKPAHVVTTVSHLLRRGVRIPEDMSLISRDDDPLLEYLVPTVARYHSDAELFARKISRLVVDLVQMGVRRRHDIRLVPRFLRGETLGSARVTPLST
jgi:LacI family transcriptional regulator